MRLGPLVAGVDLADTGVQRRALVGSDRGIERPRCVATVGGPSLVDDQTIVSQTGRQLSRRRLVTELLRKSLGHRAKLRMQLLDSSTRADGPAVVTEVAFELAGDRWNGVRDEGRA